MIDIAVMAALVIVGRILTFQRRGSRYRRGISFVAWLVTCANFTLIVKLPGMPPPEPVTTLLAIWQVAFAILLLRHGGNLAHLLRSLHLTRRH
ncbi:phage holin family protein [Halomonas binhaiensis]|uniref:Phage holin family protein n=1 Tax=Halomonas binhaiensis TaxID=2562282 RepID=A0A5C1NB71_9GAMM|nr:phage holin family protein [Halomonas binhaiensis]QEM80221.1 phage holin family protein [Halomonas binhaiensis]